jgi:hypothetical protein
MTEIQPQQKTDHGGLEPGLEVAVKRKNPCKKPCAAVFVYPETRRKLAVARAKYGFRSYDELISYLLEKVGYA